MALLDPLHAAFYGNGLRKQIPNLVESLSPLGLAVWYMDDGGKRGDCGSGYLNTNAYSVDDVQVLRACIDQNFGIRTRVHFAAAKPRIYVPAGQFAQFCELIRPHMIDEMRYKLL